MSQLILVRHALPEVDPQIPPAEWPLSPEGRKAAVLLAKQLAEYNPTHIFSSVEPKAHETGKIAGELLGVAISKREGLHEHDRKNEGYVSDHAARVREFFARPRELVYGNESAAQALARFVGAINEVLFERPNETVVVVAHGTIMSLFAAEHSNIDGFQLWQSLKMPCALVFALPDKRLQMPAPICLPENNDLD